MGIFLALPKFYLQNLPQTYRNPNLQCSTKILYRPRKIYKGGCGGRGGGIKKAARGMAGREICHWYIVHAREKCVFIQEFSPVPKSQQQFA